MSFLRQPADVARHGGVVQRGPLGLCRLACPPSLAGTSPFLWSVHDNAFPAELVETACESFPAPEWHGWVKYDSPGEAKVAANSGLAFACLRLLDAMNDLCPEGLRHDPKFYGAGVSMMPPGGWLDLHLDASIHPATGYRRAVNLILFLDE